MKELLAARTQRKNTGVVHKRLKRAPVIIAGLCCGLLFN